MIIRDAIRSLRKDRTRSFFYWLTFLLTSMFFLLFFSVLYSDARGTTFIESNEDMFGTFIIVSVLIICFVAILFANDFFVKNKASEIAVRLVCGATFIQIAGYLLVQTFLLLAIAIPIGILLTMLMIPLLNTVFTALMHQPFTITIGGDAVRMTTIMIVAEIAWTTMLNLSFAYVNTIATMMNPNRSLKEKRSTFGGVFARIPPIVLQVLATALFIIPIVNMFTSEVPAVSLACFSLVGFYFFVDHVVIAYEDRKVRASSNSPRLLASSGFLRTDLRILKSNYILLTANAALLVSMICDRHEDTYQRILFLVSYILMQSLLTFAMMFRHHSEISSRTRFFRALNRIGYMEGDLKAIVMSETVRTYGFIMAVLLLMLGCITVSYLLRGLIDFSLIIVLVVVALVPLLLCAVITYFYFLSMTKEVFRIL